MRLESRVSLLQNAFLVLLHHVLTGHPLDDDDRRELLLLGAELHTSNSVSYELTHEKDSDEHEDRTGEPLPYPTLAEAQAGYDAAMNTAYDGDDDDDESEDWDEDHANY